MLLSMGQLAATLIIIIRITKTHTPEMAILWLKVTPIPQGEPQTVYEDICPVFHYS